MGQTIFILVNVAVAALIGWVTNWLAIKMLFHPREAVNVGGRRLWFTPGLIPKRKTEIGKSLGAVVANYLVTSEGLSVHLDRPAFRDSLKRSILQGMERLSSSDQTIRSWLEVRIGEEETQRWTQKSIRVVTQWLGSAGERYWNQEGWKDRQLKEWLNRIDEERRQSWIAGAAIGIQSSLLQELNTDKADRLIRGVIRQFTEGTGGFLGTLAGMFVDEDKLLRKAKNTLSEQLGSPSVRGMLEGLLLKQLEQIGELSLMDIVKKLNIPISPLEDESAEEYSERVKGYISNQAEQYLKLDRAADWILNKPLSHWARELPTRAEPYIDRVVALLIKGAQQNMDRIITAVKLPEIVEAQVAKFPVERLEDIVLSVSGKEFQAITWLGALLGGLIGLLQALMLMLYNPF